MGRKFLVRPGGIWLSAALCLVCMSPPAMNLVNVPSEIRLSPGEAAHLPGGARVDQEAQAVSVSAEGGEMILCAQECEGSAEVVYRLLGLIPVKTVSVTVEEPKVLIPGGQSVGVALSTRGVLVVGNSDVDGVPSPGRLAGLRSGDLILAANETRVDNAAKLSQLAQQGGEMTLTVRRDGLESSVRVAPALDRSDGTWRLGVWVRDSAAGMGTMTYYDPETSGYGALGHAVTDVDTNLVLPIGEGAIYEGTVLEIQKGAPGRPGELIGSFAQGIERAGTLVSNTDFGVFGALERPLENPLYPEGLPAATRSEVRTGDAEILTTLDDGGLRAYDIEITKLYDQKTPSTRSMVIEVTDPALLAATGGIVQGMSGSPIIQDGKIVGAVTHVLVNDPTTGYGIYLENMLEAS